MSTNFAHPRRSVRRFNRNVRRAFTLIEVMLVVVIILAIMAVVGFNLFGAKQKADTSLVEVQLKSFKSAIQAFQLDYGRFPTETEGLKVLWDKTALDPEADAAKYRAGGYLAEPVPQDMWNREWGYIPQAEDAEEGEMAFDVWSVGPDGQEGTDDDLHLRKPRDELASDSAPAPSGSGSSSSGG